MGWRRYKGRAPDPCRPTVRSELTDVPVLRELAWIVFGATAALVVARALRLPPVVGYLLSGLVLPSEAAAHGLLRCLQQAEPSPRA